VIQRPLALFAGGLAVALGLLWLLQGLGVVRLKPILCVAACQAVEGPSIGWVIAGLALAGVGAAAVLGGLRRR